MEPAVEFKDLSVATAQGRKLLHGISLRIEQGLVIAILGRSGSGKTTVLRTVNRMIEPSDGAVFVEGRNVAIADRIALRRGMGYVIQETGLFPHFTVGRNAAVVLEAMGTGADDRKRRAHELLTAVGLEPETFAGRYPHQLSGGQRQRVGLARALAADPAILLMDEPFGALDPLTRAEMQDMLRGLLGGMRKIALPKTVLLVTHDLDEALYLADRIVLLSDGRVAADLAPAEFLQSEHPEVTAYREAFHRGERSSTRGQKQRQPEQLRPEQRRPEQLRPEQLRPEQLREEQP